MSPFIRVSDLHGRLISPGGHLESGHRLSIVYLFVDGYRIIRRAQSSAERAPYVDTALTPAEEDDFEHLAMFTATAGAEPAIARKRRQDKIRVEFGATAKHGE